MKRNYNLIVTMLLFMLSFSLFAQEDADISTSKEKENKTVQFDTRIDNMGYWKQLAADGIIPYSQPIPVKPAEYKGSIIEADGIKAIDSPDVPVTSSTSVTESENSIFVDPNDNQFIINSNNSTSWTGSSVGTLYGANYFQSANGGSTWGGSALGVDGDNSGDPTTAINTSGRQFVNFIDDPGGQSISYSDNGTSWTTASIGPNPGSLADKNHMWVDNSSTSPYAGNLYCAWTDFGGSYDYEVVFSRSTNDGASWSTRVPISGTISSFDHGVNLQTGPAGEVYACWATYPSSPLTENGIGFAKSTNGGSSFSTSTKVISTIQGIRSLGTSKNMRVNSFPVMAVDISGGPNNGNIYIVWSNYGNPNSGNSGTNISVYMIRSTNGGTSWTAPIRVNQGPLSNDYEAYSPWITADPETGAIAVVYYEDRNIASHPTTSCEAWVSYSTDAGNNWTAMRVSDVSFTPSPIPGLANDYMGDYLAITSKGGMVYPCWTDTRGGLYMTYVSPFEIGLNAAFTADATNICTGSNVVFTDLSTGSPATYSWTFTSGTPGTATGAGPHNITYSTPGTYNVSLTVTDGGSGTDTETKSGYITVENVIADFTGTPTTVIVGNTVTFTDNSACGPTSWNWTFPGGTPGSATGIGPHTITYNTIGTYNVTLAVTSGANNDTETKTNYIDVINCNYCATSYSNTADDYVSNVSFNTINNPSGSTTYSDFTSISTNISTGNTYSISADITVNGSWTQHCWVWIDWNRDCDFDDAGEGFDLGQTPGTAGTHTLTTNITVPSGASLGSTRMRVSELYSADPEPCTVSTYGEAEDYTVVIQSNIIPPVADFSADDTTPAVGQTVSFTDLSSNGPSSWSWTISPGTFNYTGGSNSSSQNPQVQFNSSGYYTVELTATNANGNDGETKTNYILAGTAGNWTGASSTVWNLAANWENLAIPNSTDDVTIPASAAYFPILNNGFATGSTCNNMTMEGNSTFTVMGDFTISSGKSFICNGSNSISVEGDWANHGTFVPGTGTVEIYGNSTSTIIGSGSVNSSLQTTFAGGNGSNGNMFDIVALNEVTITSFDGNLDPGTGDVHVYYKTGTYVGFETNSSAWTFVGTTSVTSTTIGVPTAIPVPVNITVPAGQTYAFYVHAENGNEYTNGTTAGNVFVSDANIQILEGCGKGAPLFTGGTYSPRVFNGTVHYSYSGGSGALAFNNLLINKTNEYVSNHFDLDISGDLTVNSQSYFTNNNGYTITVTGNLLIEGTSTGKGSFIDNGTTTVSGTSTVQKYYTDSRWHYITSPVTNTISNNFFGMYLYYWLEDSYSWFNVVSTDSLLRVGKGYGLWSTISNPTIDFSGGSLNTGNISIPVKATDSNGGGMDATEGWNLIGNPYPSAIDLGAPGNVLPGYTWTNITSTVYMNDGTQYATYNPYTGFSTNGATQYIPSMQGFFVKADNTNPALTIPNSARLHSPQANYKSSVDYQMLKLVTQGNGYSDEILIMASEEATSGFDSKYDAYKMMGKEEAPQLYCILPEMELSVNTLDQITEETVIELGIKTGVAGSYNIGISELEQFDNYPYIILEDLQTNIFVNLLTTEIYQFSSTPEDISHRFNLHFKDVGVGMIENTADALLVYSYKDVIYIETEVAFSGEVKVFDMMGQQIYHKAAEASTGINIPITNGTGYYLVKIQTSSKLTAKKVFIK